MEKPVLPIAVAIRREMLLVSLAIGSYALPFLLGHSQFLTGPLVNAALFIAALTLPSRFLWPMVVLPALAVLSRGLIFGPFTPFLVYFLPFIWLGNLTLVLVFRRVCPLVGFSGSILLAAAAKTIFLFSFANLLFKLGLLPKIFLTTMGLNQFLTALVGGFLAYIFFKTAHGRR